MTVISKRDQPKDADAQVGGWTRHRLQQMDREYRTAVLRALARCLSRKRDSTSMVMLADAQPMKSTPWNIGTRKERIGKPVSGLIAGSVTASVRVILAT